MILGLHASVMLTPQIRWNHPRDSAFQKYRWHPKSLMAPWIIDGRPDLGNFSLILIDTSTPSAALIVHPFNLFMMARWRLCQGLLSHGDSLIMRKNQVLPCRCLGLKGSREGWRKKFFSWYKPPPPRIIFEMHVWWQYHEDWEALEGGHNQSSVHHRNTLAPLPPTHPYHSHSKN